MQPTKKKALFLACVGNNDYLCISVMKRTEDEYYIESKRIRNEVLAMAEALKEHPLQVLISLIIREIFAVKRFFVCENSKTAISSNLMQSLTSILSMQVLVNCENKKNSVLTSRLPIQTGLLS